MRPLEKQVTKETDIYRRTTKKKKKQQYDALIQRGPHRLVLGLLKLRVYLNPFAMNET